MEKAFEVKNDTEFNPNKVSYYEIYNEKVINLLDENESEKEKSVNDIEEAFNYYLKGSSVRKVK